MCVRVCVCVCVCICMCVRAIGERKEIQTALFRQSDSNKMIDASAVDIMQQISTIRLYKHRSTHSMRCEEIPDMKRYPSLSRLPMSPVLNHPCSPSAEQVQEQVQVYT